MSHHCFHRFFPRHSLLAAALSLPLAALAQSDAPRQNEAQTLDTLNVTAQRKLENIREVPVSITALSGEPLDVLGSGGADIRFLSGRVPSLNIESSYGRAFPRFYIRGLGNTDFDLNASQPVSLVYDDVVQESPLLKGFPIFDLEQIEVLRGPQGTLFGRNTPAGVVKFESAKPTKETGGYAQVNFGSDDLFNFEGAIGGALSPRWSARVSALYQHRGDFVKNTHEQGKVRALEGYDESAARVQFLYEGDGFEGLFNLHRRKLDGTARVFYANNIEPGTNHLAPGFNRKRIAVDGENFSELTTWGANARLRWDMDSYSLHSITGYETAQSLNRGDVDGGWGAGAAGGPGLILFPSETADGLPEHKQISQELRLESDLGGRFDWQAGLFWYKEDIGIDNFNYDSLTAGNPQTGHVIQSQVNKAWAVFASGEYAATERLKLRAGVRYTQDEKDFSAQVLQGVPGATPAGPPVSVSTDAEDISWDASAVFDVNKDVNVYGRIAKGFRAPSIQGRLAFGNVTQADSEEVISYEIGIKADLFDRRARVGFNIFRYNVDGQQLIAVGGATNQANLLNADKTVGQGVELDLQAYLSDRLFVTLGSSFNDTEIRDADLAVAGCAQCTVTDPLAREVNGVRFYRIGGNSLPQAPEWVHNLTARWSIPVRDNGEFFVFTDWAYRSKVNFFLYESIEFTGKSLLEGGLRVGYQWNHGDYELALFGRNITDTTRVVGAIDFNNLTGFLNEPRQVGVEFSARF